MQRFRGVSGYEMTVRQGAEALREKLSQFKGLSLAPSTAATGEQQLHFALEHDEAIDDVAKLTLQDGHGLIALRPQTASLEEIFTS